MAFRLILVFSVILSISVMDSLSFPLDSLQKASTNRGKLESQDIRKGHFDAIGKAKRHISIKNKREEPPTVVEEAAISPCSIRTVTLLEEDFQDLHVMGLSDVAVSSIQLSYCEGHCHWHFEEGVNSTRSGYLQGAISALIKKMPDPCCAPSEFEDVVYPATGVRTGEYTVAIPTVRSCECR